MELVPYTMYNCSLQFLIIITLTYSTKWARHDSSCIREIKLAHILRNNCEYLIHNCSNLYNNLRRADKLTSMMSFVAGCISIELTCVYNHFGPYLKDNLDSYADCLNTWKDSRFIQTNCQVCKTDILSSVHSVGCPDKQTQCLGILTNFLDGQTDCLDIKIPVDNKTDR